MGIRLIVLLLALAPSVAMAQKVYKCTSADGTPVYSQQPCAENAREIVVKAPTAATDRGDQASVAAMHRNVAVRNAEIAENNCIAAAEERAWRPANKTIADHERRIAALNYDVSRARNNLAGATWQAGLRQEIAGLQQAISTERATAQTLATAGREQCAEARRRKDEEIEAESVTEPRAD